MFNTIVLQRGETILTNKEYKGFTPGDTIWGDNANTEGIAMWDIEDEELAKKELAEYRCSYQYDVGQNRWYITEYALEYFESKDCEFIEGSDYDLAETE